MDFAGPVHGKMILIIVDSHSKWIEAFPTDSSTSSKVIELSRTLFAQFGVPEVIVTDNGPCFVSEEFEMFLIKNGVKHIASAPYHPATNGLAERAVQTVKRGLKKETQGTCSLATRLAKVLMTYRTTPQNTTGVSPSELLLGHRIRTRLDLLKPNVSERVEHQQLQHKRAHDSSARGRTFSKGETVYAKGFGTGQQWIPAVIQEVTGPVSYLVKLNGGHMVRRHQDHLRHRMAPNEGNQAEKSGETAADAALPEETPDIEPELEVPFETPHVLEPSVTSSADSAGAAEGQGTPQPSREERTTSSAPRVNSGEPNVSMETGSSNTSKSYPQRSRQHPDWYVPK